MFVESTLISKRTLRELDNVTTLPFLTRAQFYNRISIKRQDSEIIAIMYPRCNRFREHCVTWNDETATRRLHVRFEILCFSRGRPTDNYRCRFDLSLLAFRVSTPFILAHLINFLYALYSFASTASLKFPRGSRYRSWSLLAIHLPLSSPVVLFPPYGIH